MSSAVFGTLVLSAVETDEQRTARVLANLDGAGLRGLVENVAARFAVTPEQLASRERTKSVVRARQTAWWSISAVFGKSTTEIGSLFAVDHSTVVHGLQVMKRRAEEALDAA